MVLGTGKEEIRRQQLEEKMELLRDKMRDVRTNIAWKKKLDAKKPAKPPPVSRWDFGILRGGCGSRRVFVGVLSAVERCA